MSAPRQPQAVPFGADDTRDENGHLVRELHGVTLAHILETLVADLGWEGLLAHVRINCFAHDPSVKSSLTFLRRTPWARSEVEALYIARESQRRRDMTKL
jgi:uncharacterized protein (DUF2132 family)